MVMVASSRLMPGIIGATILAATLMLSGCSELYSHEQFVTLVKDKSEMEVVDQIGRPASVDKSNPSRVTLTYTTRTYDIDKQNKFDAKAIVVLTPVSSGGALKVTDVQFQ